MDHINPDYAWPEVDHLESLAEHAGIPLVERLPIYDRYLPEDLHGRSEWLRRPVRNAMLADAPPGARFRSLLS